METKRRKKVGIISEEAHAKPLVQQLENAGYEPVVLGGNVTSLPPSLDVLVCRTKSCSHESSATAFAASREQGLPLVVQNGVTAIMREVVELLETDKEVDVEEVETESLDCRSAMLQAIHAGGMYFLKMAELTPTQITECAVAMGLVAGLKARVRAHASYDAVLRFADKTQDKTFRRLLRDNANKDSWMLYGSTTERKEGNSSQVYIHQLYYQTKGNRMIHTMQVLSRQPLALEQVETLARTFGYLVKPEPEVAAGKWMEPSTTEEEDLTPFRQGHYRAYYVRKDKRWRVCDQHNQYITQVKTRGDVLVKMEELEALHFPTASPVYSEPSPVIEAVLAAPEVVAAAPVVEVSPEKEVVVLTPEQELEETLRKARDLMNKLGKRVMTFEGMKAHVLATHLLSPKGKGCDHVLDGEVVTKDISQVTCEHCKSTEFYTMAEFALLTLTIG